MTIALEQSGIAPTAIAAIWASAAGHRQADRAEDAAIRRLFGESPPPILSPKLLLGEPMGAGGAVSAALALKQWQREGVGNPGPVLVNSDSMGGTHFSIVLSPFS